MQNISQVGDKFFFRIKDVAEILSVSRSRVYELMRSGELSAVREGRKTLVPRMSLLELVRKWNSLPRVELQALQHLNPKDEDENFYPESASGL